MSQSSSLAVLKELLAADTGAQRSAAKKAYEAAIRLEVAPAAQVAALQAQLDAEFEKAKVRKTVNLCESTSCVHH